MSEKPCEGCDEDENVVYREGKIPMRFIRSNRKVGMRNYNDGEIYWMYPRHARYAWFEAVGVPEMPVVPEATEEESVFEVTGSTEKFRRVISEDTLASATIGESGFTLTGSGALMGSLRDAHELEDDSAEILLPDEPKPLPSLEPEPRNLGFPHGENPSGKWKKAQLLAYIWHKGGVADIYMKKDLLLTVASSLT